MNSTNFRAPFLKEVLVSPPPGAAGYPFNIPVFSREFSLELSEPVTFFIGENGSGKSTLLEAIASKIGFSLGGGSRNHTLGNAPEDAPLAVALRLSWLPKINTGFFMRAESFFNLASLVDEVTQKDPLWLKSYGGKSLHEQSHGESFLALFANKFRQRGIYLLDEPEAALSPMRQLGFLALIKRLERTGRAQFIIASHAPILLSYPGAKILSFDGGEIKPIQYTDTEHYKLTKAFLDSPERYFKHLFSESEG